MRLNKPIPNGPSQTLPGGKGFEYFNIVKWAENNIKQIHQHFFSPTPSEKQSSEQHDSHQNFF
jgi:hypothetical protein